LLIAGTTAVGWRTWKARHASTAAQPSLPARTFAILPSVDNSGDPQFEFASAGLPHLLGTEMRRVSNMNVIGNYQLRDAVASSRASLSDWLTGAQKMGAQMAVGGELAKSPQGVRITVFVLEVPSGRQVGRFQRDASSDKFADVVALLARDVIAATL